MKFHIPLQHDATLKANIDIVNHCEVSKKVSDKNFWLAK